MAHPIVAPGALWIACALACAAFSAFAAAPGACSRAADDGCYAAFEPSGAGGRLNYYTSRVPDAAGPGPTRALIALHGHPRDANKTFDAALLAVRRAGDEAETVVVAPVFQVDAARDRTCRTAGVPDARPGDLLWTCASWIEGGTAANGTHAGSFAVLDALVAEVLRRWPSLRTVTVAGFSAGAQMVQHAIGFAAAPPSGVALRYVVADPGSWLYFDAFRPRPVDAGSCPDVNRWKYGTEALPAHLARDPAEARARYAAAEIHYLEGELDGSDAPGTAYRVLDRSCAANAQGPFRRQRGQAYADHDPAARALTVVPGCAHDVACVFPSPAARAALTGRPR